MGEQTAGMTMGTLDREAIKAEIHEFLAVNFGSLDQTFTLPDDASLLGSGLLDQTGVVELVLFVEEAYGFDVDESELTQQNFDTVNGIVAFVARRLSGQQPS